MFLLPSFVNKTFFTEKSVFLKFFYNKLLKFKLLNYKKPIEFFKNKISNNFNFNINNVKSIFLFKMFKSFQNKYKNYKFDKIVKNNNTILVNSYWNLFSKNYTRTSYYNFNNYINLQFFNYAFEKFRLIRKM